MVVGSWWIFPQHWQMRLGTEYQVNFFWAQKISSLLHSLVGLLCLFLWGWKRLTAISYWFFEISSYLIQHSLKQRHLRIEKVWFKKIQVCLINMFSPRYINVHAGIWDTSLLFRFELQGTSMRLGGAAVVGPLCLWQMCRGTENTQVNDKHVNDIHDLWCRITSQNQTYLYFSLTFHVYTPANEHGHKKIRIVERKFLFL